MTAPTRHSIVQYESKASLDLPHLDRAETGEPEHHAETKESEKAEKTPKKRFKFWHWGSKKKKDKEAEKEKEGGTTPTRQEETEQDIHLALEMKKNAQIENEKNIKDLWLTLKSINVDEEINRSSFSHGTFLSLFVRCACGACSPSLKCKHTFLSLELKASFKNFRGGGDKAGESKSSGKTPLSLPFLPFSARGLRAQYLFHSVVFLRGAT